MENGMTATTVQVKHLITDVDMRPTRALISGKFKIFGQLGRGQIALLLNRSCTIARFIDSEKTIHTMYAEKGEKYDLATIESMVKKRTLAIGVNVIRGRGVKAKHVTGITSERIVKPHVKKRRTRRAA
jgi:hypothetical protein